MQKFKENLSSYPQKKDQIHQNLQNSDLVLTLPTRIKATEKRNISSKKSNLKLERSQSPGLQKIAQNTVNNAPKTAGKPKKKNPYSKLNQSFSSQNDLFTSNKSHIRLNTPPVSQFDCEVGCGEINLYEKKQSANKNQQNTYRVLKVGEQVPPSPMELNNFFSDQKQPGYKYLFNQKKKPQKPQNKAPKNPQNSTNINNNQPSSCNNSQIYPKKLSIKRLKSHDNITNSLLPSNNNSILLENTLTLQDNINTDPPNPQLQQAGFFQNKQSQQQQQQNISVNVKPLTRYSSPQKQPQLQKQQQQENAQIRLTKQFASPSGKLKTTTIKAKHKKSKTTSAVQSLEASPQLLAEETPQQMNLKNISLVKQTKKKHNHNNTPVIQSYIHQLQQMKTYSDQVNEQNESHRKGRLSRQLSPERPQLTKKTVAQYQNLMKQKLAEKQQEEELNQKLKKYGVKSYNSSSNTVKPNQINTVSQQIKNQKKNSIRSKNNTIKKQQQLLIQEQSTEHSKQSTPSTEKKKPKHIYQAFDEDKEQTLNQSQNQSQNQQLQSSAQKNNNNTVICESEKTQYTIGRDQDSEIILLLGENDDTINNNNINTSFVSFKHQPNHQLQNENLTQITVQKQQSLERSSHHNINNNNDCIGYQGFKSEYQSVQQLLNIIEQHKQRDSIVQPQFTAQDMKVLKNIPNSNTLLLNYVFQTHYDIHMFMGTQPNETEVFYNNYREQLNTCYIIPQLPKEIPNNKKYTLVLDMDETLIHCLGTKEKKSDKYQVSELVVIRPHVHQFLEELSEYYEIVLFTAAIQHYADSVIDQILDPEGKYISHRFYREHCKLQECPEEGILRTKDITTMGRDMSKIIIIDDKEENLLYQQQNGLLISAWEGDSEDSLLQQLVGFLKSIVEENGDVQKAIQYLKAHTQETD